MKNVPNLSGRIHTILVMLLVLLWSYAGAIKLVDHAHTLHAMQHQVFSKPIAAGLSFLLPVLELFTAILLAAPRTRLAGLWLSLLLMGLFTGYILLVLNNFFGHTPCFCGGLFERMGWHVHFIFNLFVLLLNGIALGLHKISREGEPPHFNGKEATAEQSFH